MKHNKLVVLIIFVAILLNASLIGFAETETELSSELVCSENTKNDSTEEDNKNLKKDLVLSLLAEFVGAFLGVLTALGLNKYAEIKSVAKLKMEIYAELKKIFDELDNRLKQKNDYIFYQYSTPIWNIYLATGNLTLFISRKKYKPYIDVYAKIQYAQSLENEYANIRTLSNNETDSSFEIYKKTIEDARKREAQEIYNMISVLKKDVK